MSSIDSFIDRITNAGKENDGPSPIGVPTGFVPPTQHAGPVRPDLNEGGYLPIRDVRAEPYMEGDEWRPASQPPQAVAQLQQRLVSGGLLTGSYHIGVWDDPSRNAYKNLLEFANGLGVTNGAALGRYQASAPSPEVEAPRAPLVTKVTHPDDIRRGLRSMFRERLGRGGRADDPTIDAMVTTWQQMEADSQRAAYNAAETGGTVVEPPSFETFADEQAKRRDPVGYDARKVVDAAAMMFSILGGDDI